MKSIGRYSVEIIRENMTVRVSAEGVCALVIIAAAVGGLFLWFWPIT